MLSAALLGGCGGVGFYEGTWCGSAVWNYPLLETAFGLEGPFRDDSGEFFACWSLDAQKGELSMYEPLSTDPSRPPGYCLLQTDKDLNVVDGDCAFWIEAYTNDDPNSAFWIENRFDMRGGTVSAGRLGPRADIDAMGASDVLGDVWWGEATLTYEASFEAADRIEHPIQGGGLPADCPLDGCMTGAYSGNVVAGPNGCQNIFDGLDVSGTRVELQQGGRAMLVDGVDVAVFPRAETCEAIGWQQDGDRQWNYTVRRDNGEDFVELTLFEPIDQGGEVEWCEFWWTTPASSC